METDARNVLPIALLALLGLIVGSGCNADRIYYCTVDRDCEGTSAQGVCEPSGFCSVPDPDCASGRRYDEGAPAGIEGDCVVGGGVDAGLTHDACSSGAFGRGFEISAGRPLSDPAFAADATMIYLVAPGLGDDTDIVATSLDLTQINPLDDLSGVAAVSSGDHEAAPFVSRDGLELYFASDRSNPGTTDLWVASRQDTSSPFESPVRLTTVSSATNDTSPFVSNDGLTLYFASDRPALFQGMNLWRSTRADPDAMSPNAQLVAGINTDADETSPAMSDDELVLLFASDRPGGLGGHDIWTASRADLGSAFTSPANDATVSSQSDDYEPELSRDGSLLIFATRSSGSGPSVHLSTRDCAD